MITYLMSSYQKARYLPAVLAALAADRQGLASEVFIIDDGSRDESLELLRAFATQNQGVDLAAQENRGIFAVTNQLLAKGSMPFIRILDSDDPVVPGSTRRMIEGAERHRLDYLFGGRLEYGPEPLSPPLPAAPASPPMSIELIDDPVQHAVVGYNHVPSCTLIRRDAAARCGSLPEQFLSCQDLALALRIFQNGRVGRTDEPVCHQLVGIRGRLSANEALTFQQTIRVIEEFGEHGFDARMQSIAARKLVSRTLRRVRNSPSRYRASEFIRLGALRVSLALGFRLSWKTYLDGAAAPLERELEAVLAQRRPY